MGLMNKDIRDIHITRSLRRLGNVQVMDWDFGTVMPSVHRMAYREVDLVDIFKRTANYRIMEWDFRNSQPPDSRPCHCNPGKPEPKQASPAEMQAIIVRMKNFLQFVVVNLIDEPNHAQIKVREIEPNVLRFKLILVKRDVAMLIGREGHTATAIRNILKTAAGMNGVQALLQILSHEEVSKDGGSE